MAQTVIMPKLGQATEESTIVKWHKQEGDLVKKGDILFEMETDKAVLETESFFDGTLLKILVKEGETVPVNVPVAFIGKRGEALPKAAAMPAATQEREVRGQRSEVGSQESAVRKPQAAPAPAPRPAPAAPTAPVRLLISPRARALAAASAISPAPVRGSGPSGRITEADVRAYLAASHYDRLRISPAAKKLAIKEKIDILKVQGAGTAGRIMTQDVERAMAERPRPMSRMRQTIARRLTESFTGTPHFYVTVSVDMTDLMAYRQELKARGGDFTVTDFILKAVVMSLKELPVVNSVTDGTTVRWRGAVDLGVAVALDEGLVVPVVRRAEDLTLQELHDAAKALATRAREGNLLPDEMTGGSFTVSNMGMLNVDCFNAIINPGEGAILAVASALPAPAVKDGQVRVRTLMKITLSTDHRLVDGAMGAAFVNAVKSKLEDMELWKSMTS